MFANRMPGTRFFRRRATDRAGELWRAAPERYEQPPFDDDLREELEVFVAHRRAEIEAQG